MTDDKSSSAKFKMTQRKILITAGPTREWMDPVRFLSNPSTGAMGIEVARAMKKSGFDVTLVLGPTMLAVPKNIKLIRIETALEMLAVVEKNIRGCFAFIATAAVGDWRFAQTSSTKLKRGRSQSATIRLVSNPDILSWVGKNKSKRPSVVVGYALETDKTKENALKKLREKNLDLIIANNPTSFGSKNIGGLWIETDLIRSFRAGSKAQLAKQLASWIKTKWKTTTI